ncbi:hypothetical protein SMACR_03790 [Sordaria macrospora]|uniref:WGS project CABT00000000 data, contig 2.16 n=2 Tax=Sordaria macrospora TaxID=5147 RepID=F7VZY4_SORMK|nr:uncharacterized protein SMAC_03790 [Sordaria macrospora k-hell]KAA8636572.1 hypothetical protein SMACR_03790 [Sordaria macrospora]WPJ61571.1 hypothetical protein SMAC4_03790 [Sordaria macrospora]CCC11083.1 unnamed protein product [Sordaria macrospora k-hell]
MVIPNYTTMSTSDQQAIRRQESQSQAQDQGQPEPHHHQQHQPTPVASASTELQQQTPETQQQQVPQDGSSGDSSESSLEIIKDYFRDDSPYIQPQPQPHPPVLAVGGPGGKQQQEEQEQVQGQRQRQVQSHEEPSKDNENGIVINIEERRRVNFEDVPLQADDNNKDAPQPPEHNNEDVAAAAPNPDDLFPPDAAPPLEMPLKEYIFLCLGVGFGLFLSMLDTTIVATSLYEIGTEFDALDTVNWVALAYTLAFVGCAILFAKVSDVVGHRYAFAAAYVLFVAFSIECADAEKLRDLVICRAFQGVGGAGLYSLAIIILTEVTPLRWKKFIGAIIGVIIALAGVLGPVLGGVLTNYLTWRWIFWINISGIVGLVAFWFAWPRPEHLPAYQRRSWWQTDMLGSFLLTGATVLITYAFQSVRVGFGWNDNLFIGPLVGGFGSLILLMVWTLLVDNTYLKIRTTTVIPMVLIKNHVYVLMAASTWCLGFGYLMALYVFPMRFRVVNGYSALQASVVLLPMLGLSALGSMVAPGLSKKRNVLHWTIAGGGMLITLGTASSAGNAMSARRFGTTLYAVYVGLVGLGFGLSAAAATNLAIVESPVYEHATAQGLVALLRIMGGSIGIAVSGAVLGIQGSSGTPLDPEKYTKALETSMVIASAIAALGTVCALLARRWIQLPIEVMMQRRDEAEARRQAELAPKRKAERLLKRLRQQARTGRRQGEE